MHPSVDHVLAWLGRYHSRGWTLTQLHGVDELGRCTCGRTDDQHRRQAGKHPTQLTWQRAGLTQWVEIEQAWRAFPAGNVGVVTGRPSGVWVLDIDPDHGGDTALAALEAANGALPETLKVRTGSGGFHLYWLMPADGSDVTNGRGALPTGIDVRGTGGQVVAPPSRSALGPYDELFVPATGPVEAPGWLLSVIRARREVVAPAGEGTYAAELGDGGDPATAEARRVRDYAAAAARAELGMVAGAREGTRNSTAFASACALHELGNAPWSGLTVDVLWLEYMRAVSVCGLPADEAAEVWGKASARVGGRAREYPDLPRLTFQGGLDGLTAPAPSSTLAAVVPETGALDPVDAFIARLLTSAALDTVPDLEPLIDGYLYMDTLSWVIGKPGEGKSFVVLDFALAVATGRAWMGRETHSGLVVYIVAEGARGMRPRVRAWEKHNNSGARVENILFYPMPVRAADAQEWAVVVEVCRRLQPAYVVIDTQARTTIGLKENDNTEMSLFVDRCDELRRASAACVTLVHHVNSAGQARGASALLGAAQTELTVSRVDREVTLTVTKQKDSPELDPVTLTMQTVELRELGLDDSVVLVPRTRLTLEEQAARLAAEADSRSLADQTLAGLFADVFAEGRGGTKAEVGREFVVAFGRSSEGTRSTSACRKAFYRSWNKALDKGMIVRVSGTQSYRWVPAAERMA